MNDAESAGRIPLQLSQSCVVASIQVDLSDGVLALFREQLLALLHSSGARGVILDVSGVEIMDLSDFEALRRAMSMAEVMGARCLLAGLPIHVDARPCVLVGKRKEVSEVLALDDGRVGDA